MKTVCIVQARMASKRLPGKVLLPLNGHTVIGEVLTRCKKIPGIDQVVCAIFWTHENQPLYDEAGNYADVAWVAAQSENDVLARYEAVASAHEADVVMRITGDCPLISPELCGAVLKKLIQEKADYASNIEPRTFPKGVDCEAFTFRLLQRANAEATSREDREHVTPWMRRQNIKRVNITSSWPIDGRLCLDTEDDYRVLCAAFGQEPYQHILAA